MRTIQTVLYQYPYEDERTGDRRWQPRCAGCGVKCSDVGLRLEVTGPMVMRSRGMGCAERENFCSPECFRAIYNNESEHGEYLELANREHAARLESERIREVERERMRARVIASEKLLTQNRLAVRSMLKPAKLKMVADSDCPHCGGRGYTTVVEREGEHLLHLSELCGCHIPVPL